MRIKSAKWLIALFCVAPLFTLQSELRRPSVAEPRAGRAGVETLGARSAADTLWADSVLATLTLRQKAAQMVWPNLIGDYVSSDSRQWKELVHLIEVERVGGLLISVGSPIEIAQKLNELQSHSRIPLLVSADLETGAGMRARGGYFVPNAIDLGGATQLPTNMAIGATGDTALAYEAGKLTALEGRRLGIHISYAPVLDVNNNPDNPVINTRSYGEDPHQVARMGSAFIRGLQNNGMIATAKHFPGHGDTDVNSHLSLPIVNVSRARLDSVELVPFIAAIKAGVGAVMSFHGALPALDSSNAPGTLSKPVITGLLRNELNFRGLVISDAMDMGGVVNTYGAARSAQLAVAAGLDVLIQPPDAKIAIDAIVAGVEQGLYDEAHISRSVQKILIEKHRLGLQRGSQVRLAEIREHVGGALGAELSRQIAQRSLTLLKGTDGVLIKGADGVLTESPDILSVTFAPRADLAAGVHFNAELRNGGVNVQQEFIALENQGYNFRYLDSLVDAAAEKGGRVVVSSYVGQRWNVTTAAAPAAFVQWVNGLEKRGIKVMVLAFGNPYLIQQMPEVTGYLIAWSGVPSAQSAAAEFLLGKRGVKGRLPVRIPPFYSIGDGLTYPSN